MNYGRADLAIKHTIEQMLHGEAHRVAWHSTSRAYSQALLRRFVEDAERCGAKPVKSKTGTVVTLRNGSRVEFVVKKPTFGSSEALQKAAT
jgi:hypothetical protein